MEGSEFAFISRVYSYHLCIHNHFDVALDALKINTTFEANLENIFKITSFAHEEDTNPHCDFP